MIMAEVYWTSEAKKDLKKLDSPVKKRILKKISWFAENLEHLTPKSLSGEYSNLYKLRVGDWRVIYDFKSGSKIAIRFIGHRSEIYK
jgi:mRNA interferase RelE/StbE